ncbi:hypothetical protein ACFSBZ_16390 [Amnibacterium flavum]|uniref:hypothetical protein n=1 Tax=Amnibacterium flavum TaxID=2173173 RepID=UPI001057F23F|nr:hypothetical protein [Amnibacterium flavum]
MNEELTVRVVSVLTGIGLVAAGVTAPANVGEGPISAAEQARYAEQVAAFVHTYPEPVVDALEGSAAWDRQVAARGRYWLQVPWEAVLGQWGQRADSVDVAVAEDGLGVLRASTAISFSDASGAEDVHIEVKARAHLAAAWLGARPQGVPSGLAWRGDSFPAAQPSRNPTRTGEDSR